MGAPLNPWGTSPGSLGRLPGAPWGGVPAQCLRPVSCTALSVFASFFISILMLIFDRLGVDLGSVFGVSFGRFGALVGQSCSQNRLRIVLASKTYVHEALLGFLLIFDVFFTQDGGPRRPKIAQDGTKIVLDNKTA